MRYYRVLCVWVDVVLSVGPADCDEYNRNHMLLSESSNVQYMLAQVLQHFVVTVAIVTVCELLMFVVMVQCMQHAACLYQHATLNKPQSGQPSTVISKLR